MPRRDWISKEHDIFRLDSGAVYARQTIPGLGRKEFSLGRKYEDALPVSPKELKALIRLKDSLVAAMIRENKPTPKGMVRFEALAEEVIKLKGAKSASTLGSAELQLRKHLIPWFNDHCPFVADINEATWEEYIIAAQAARPGHKMMNARKHMVMVMKLAYQKGITPRPMKFRNPDPERAAGKRYTQAEIERLLVAASPTLRLQILMAVTMGMRKSEALLLSWDRVNLEDRTIHLRSEDTKIRRKRTMGMNAAVYRALRALDVTASPYVFPSRYNPGKPSRSNKTAWRAAKRRAQVRGRFHDLRHTFLTVALLEKKMNPLHVAVYAGVSLAEIQKTYLHPSVEDTRDVAGAILVRGKSGGTK